MATAGCSRTFIAIYQTTRRHIARTCQRVICSAVSHRKDNTLVPQKFEYSKDKYLCQLKCIISILWCVADLGKDSFLNDIRKVGFFGLQDQIPWAWFSEGFSQLPPPRSSFDKTLRSLVSCITVPFYKHQNNMGCCQSSSVVQY